MSLDKWMEFSELEGVLGAETTMMSTRRWHR